MRNLREIIEFWKCHHASRNISHTTPRLPPCMSSPACSWSRSHPKSHDSPEPPQIQPIHIHVLHTYILYIYIHMYIYIYMCYIHIHVLYTYAHIHIHVHMYKTYTYTSTHIQCSWPRSPPKTPTHLTLTHMAPYT